MKYSLLSTTQMETLSPTMSVIWQHEDNKLYLSIAVKDHSFDRIEVTNKDLVSLYRLCMSNDHLFIYRFELDKSAYVEGIFDADENFYALVKLGETCAIHAITLEEFTSFLRSCHVLFICVMKTLCLMKNKIKRARNQLAKGGRPPL